MFLMALSLFACSDYDLKRADDEVVYEANIKVDPEVLSFGEVAEGETAIKQFDIMNIGNATLSVDNIFIEGAASFTLMGVPPTGVLEPEEQVSVSVLYEAIDGESSGFAYVASDDPDTPEAAVELIAGVGLSELIIEPNPYDFGTVSVGSTSNGTVALMNVGGAPLDIEELAITSGPFDAWLDTELPATIPAGGELDLKVSFTPTTNATATAEVRITHTADGGEDYLDLTGGGDADLPVAVCSVSPTEVEPLGTPATWLGRDSYDPGGLAITTYDWKLIGKPSGSSATMPAGAADRSGFIPDLAGTYEAELVVTNEAGLDSAPCVATLEAVPSEDLWIEMYWSRSGDDMDLHLLRPGGRLRTSDDCYYANCVGGRLDWGVRGASEDDPSLDLDDIPGTGPENINIGDPESGVFTVVVNDYPGSRMTDANDVTVKIYIGGALTWSDTRTISGDDTDTYFAEIDWAYGSGTVTGL